ncbi:acyltransferase family protein [Peribacillus frigoritolerans]|nr:acyltransferase family protein [Peribacillus frigoritolerans]
MTSVKMGDCMKNRESYFDNAKFILIILVVFGHVIRSFIDDNEFMLNVYKFVYTFHMPAFILISGFFAKGYNKKGYVQKIFKKLIIPYLIFQGIYSVYYFLVESGNTLAVDPLDPHWSLWFLMSLFFWNLFLFAYTKLDKRLAMLIAIGLGVAIGYVDSASNYLSVSRTFVFFPLFLAGFYLDKSHFKKLTAAKVRLASIALLLVTFIAYFNLDFDYEWLFGSKPYSAVSNADAADAFIRLGFYSLTFILTFSFLSLIPKRNFFFTHWGTRTFYVYLLHGFIVKSFRNSEALDWLKDYQSVTLIILLSILLTFILSTNFVKTVTQPIIELKATNLKKYFKNREEKVQYR